MLRRLNASLTTEYEVFEVSISYKRSVVYRFAKANQYIERSEMYLEN